MTIKDFLKKNPDIQWCYFPNHPDSLRRNRLIIRFWERDKTGRDKQLSKLLKACHLPYVIHANKNCFFYEILPHVWDDRRKIDHSISPFEGAIAHLV